MSVCRSLAMIQPPGQHAACTAHTVILLLPSVGLQHVWLPLHSPQACRRLWLPSSVLCPP